MDLDNVQHRQRLEITLDIFRGCGHSCSGCMIDKQLGGDVDDIPALAAMIKEMTDVGYVAFDLGVGPTDYMTSNNVDDVMNNEMFRTMSQWFHQVTFNAAFLEKDLSKYDAMCKEIDEACPGKPIRFLMPAAPSFFKSPKFGDMIREKLEHVKKTFKSAYLNEAGFVINCTHETMDDDFEAMMNNGFDVEFPVDKDDILNIPYGRLKNKDLMASHRITNVSHRISKFYSGLNGEDERRRNPDLCYSTGTMVNLLYTGGKLYWVPFLKDDCPFIEDDFEIQKPWTMDNLLKARQKAHNEAIDHVANIGCIECPYVSSCAEKGILSIMKQMDIKECLVGLQYAPESGVKLNT